MTHEKGDAEVAGWAFGDLAIDYRPTLFESDILQDRVCWVVTHIPTGLAIVALMMPQGSVRTLVEELAALTDWGPINPETGRWIRDRVFEIAYRRPDLACAVERSIPPWADISEDAPANDDRPRLEIVRSEPP